MSQLVARTAVVALAGLSWLLVSVAWSQEPAAVGQRVSSYLAETRTTITTRDGLPSDNILSLALTADGRVIAGTARGLASGNEGAWSAVPGLDERVNLVAAHEQGVLGCTDRHLILYTGRRVTVLGELPRDLQDAASQRSLLGGDPILLGTTRGLYRWQSPEKKFVPVRILNQDRPLEIRQLARSAEGRLAVAAAEGLFLQGDAEGHWQALQPHDPVRSWAPRDVRGVAFDSRDRLWFATPQGVGVRQATGWQLYAGEEGLPYNDFTTVAAGRDGSVWFGTQLGAIRFDGQRWEYRMAPRWLPDNSVRCAVIAADGTAWFGTERGLGKLERRALTLREKARQFEADIDKYHRRTPYGYVDSVHLPAPDDRSSWTQRDSDNDGLWTAMYGAGECFAYAATRDPAARKRATAAYEALRFLSTVTQGGSHPAPPGFPARSILPTSGPNPNDTHTPERDRASQASDPLWKVIAPRWPTSEDGKWYWKCDTSSDELDGHFFLYAVYYDLVAESESEKKSVREVVTAIVDHLMAHDYELIDHDGQPTRWARFGPRVLNHGILPEERGLNSVSILSYLKVAQHMTGESKYQAAYDDLIRTHGYAINTYYPKFCLGPGTGNQSDDEMAFMCYYNLLNYERDPALREIYLTSLRWYWQLEEPERNPLFNYIYCALDVGLGKSPEGRAAQTRYLTEAVDTLQRIPLDRVRWPFENSHRLDIVRMPAEGPRPRGRLRNGQVLPIDERGVEHWNHDPWTLTERHDGKTLTDGAAFLLPYYMGLHHRFILEKDE